MKKIIITAAILIATIATVNAQAVWGLRLGASMPTLVSSEGDVEGVDGKFGVEVGPVLYYSLGEFLYLNSSLSFSMKAFEDISTTWLELPVNLGYIMNFNDLSFYAQAGPYIGYKLSEKIDGKKEDFKLFSDITAGLGVMVGMNIQRFKIEIGYQYGVTNIWGKDVENLFKLIGAEKPVSHLNSFFLGVSYVF